MPKRKILIVDDEERLCRMIKLNLEETGQYEVQVETKGKQALATIRAVQPDLVLLDVVMPEVSGFDIAREIQSDQLLQKIPFAFLTAAGMADAAKQAQSKGLGSVPFLAKPISVEELLKHIEKYASKSPMSR